MNEQSNRDVLNDLEKFGLDRNTMRNNHRNFLIGNLDGPLALISDLYELADMLHEQYEVGYLDTPYGSRWFGIISDAIDFIKEHSGMERKDCDDGT